MPAPKSSSDLRRRSLFCFSLTPPRQQATKSTLATPQEGLRQLIHESSSSHSPPPIASQARRSPSLPSLLAFPFAAMNAISYAFASSATTPLLQYPIYHFARAEVIPGVSDKYTSIFAPFLAYWVFSLFFHLLDTLQWPIFERHRIHESEEVKTRNMVTVRQVILAVFVQQAIQTLLGIVWLEDDDPSVGPFRDHVGDMVWYAGWMGKAAIVVLGESRGSEVLKLYGAEAVSWVYWWGVPIVQFFFAA